MHLRTRVRFSCLLKHALCQLQLLSLCTPGVSKPRPAVKIRPAEVFRRAVVLSIKSSPRPASSRPAATSVKLSSREKRRNAGRACKQRYTLKRKKTAYRTVCPRLIVHWKLWSPKSSSLVPCFISVQLSMVKYIFRSCVCRAAKSNWNEFLCGRAFRSISFYL